jgi:ATP-dependent Clp protease protease subunit
MDPYEKSAGEILHESRVVYVSGDIATPTAESVVQRILALDAIDRRAEIKLYITSFGGSVHAGLAIYDAMQLVEAPVSTFCLGAAFSMAAWLLAAGEPGRRFAAPNARIMLHQASGGLMGTTADIQVAAENMLQTERTMNEILARHTGRTPDAIRLAIQRDLWLTPAQAKEFGLIDGVTRPAERKRGNAA